MKKVIYAISMLVITIYSLQAQTSGETTPVPTNNSGNAQTMQVGNAIQKFKMTEFMMRFSEFKNQMETDARDFIAQQNAYSTKDVRRVQTAYDRTGAKFNQILLEIKQDFMNKDKVKVINQFPDMYSNGLKGQIDGLEDFYKANFQQTLADVTEKDGSALLLVLIDLIKSAGELSQYFKNAKFEKQFMTDQYIQQHLVAPNRLPTWMELSSTTPLRTDVKMHPSRDGSLNNNNGNNNNDNNNNNNDNNNNNNGNGDNNNGDNGNGNGNNNSNDIKKQLPTKDMQTDNGEMPIDNNTEFGVEGKATIKQQSNPKNIKQKPLLNRPDSSGVKKTIKQNNPSN